MSNTYYIFEATDPITKESFRLGILVEPGTLAEDYNACLADYEDKKFFVDAYMQEALTKRLDESIRPPNLTKLLLAISATTMEVDKEDSGLSFSILAEEGKDLPEQIAASEKDEAAIYICPDLKK